MVRVAPDDPGRDPCGDLIRRVVRGDLEICGVAVVLVVRFEIAYGLMSRLAPPRGASIPTSVAANCACWNPDCPRAGGTSVNVEISFFERFTRIALNPHTCAVPG